MQPICDDFFQEVEAPAGPSSVHLNPPIRAYLEAVRKHLLGLHDAGESGRRVNEEHADLMDRLIRKLFRLIEDRYFASFPRLNFRLAIVAVGGYGRRGLSLGSDIDLIFLYRGRMNPYVETLAEAISTRLWDAGLTLGLATRTVRDCMRVGAQDLSTFTSYLDARFLIGDPGLYAEMITAVRKRLRERSSRFIEEKLEEQRRRHEQMGESLFLLQPHIRESVGGLRDYQTALWAARAVRWEVRRLEHLLLHGFIEARELERLLAALEFLWRLRNELHRNGRKEDRLHFHAQEQLADRFGYVQEGDRLPVERLMQDYYLHARTIQRVTRRAIDHALALDKQRRRGRTAPPQAIEEGFVILDGKLEIPSSRLLQDRPPRLLAAIASCQQHDVELSTRAARLLQQHVSLIDDAFRSDPENARMFRRILCSSRRVYRALIAMDELGILGAYLPEFGRVVALWQHDLYHAYTVDVHSLRVVEQLRRLSRGVFAEELPLATELAREIRSPVALYLACMLHDVGKGLGGDHPEKAAQMAIEIGRRLHLTPNEIETVEFLVRHHPTMSAVAEQRDVHDPPQILRLANLVGTRTRLRNLYLITVADIRSVSAEAWTAWKAGLLESLYRNTAEWLEAGAADEAAPRFFLERATESMVSTQKAATERLAAAGIAAEQATRFLDSMPRRYLLNHGPGEIAAHVQAALRFLDSDREIAVYPFPAQGGEEAFWGLMVLARDRHGLLSTVAGVLASLGHDILAAQVYTNRTSIAVEIYQVGVLPGGREEEEIEWKRIESRLGRVLQGQETLEQLLRGRPRTAPSSLRSRPPEVRISNKDSDFYTVIDVTGQDRPALLYDITRVLSDAGLDVFMSRVATRASRVVDTFYVTEEDHKITDPERQQQIEQALRGAIERKGG